MKVSTLDRRTIEGNLISNRVLKYYFYDFHRNDLNVKILKRSYKTELLHYSNLFSFFVTIKYNIYGKPRVKLPCVPGRPNQFYPHKTRKLESAHKTD